MFRGRVFVRYHRHRHASRVQAVNLREAKVEQRKTFWRMFWVLLFRISIWVQHLTEKKWKCLGEKLQEHMSGSYRDVTPVVTHVLDHLKWKIQRVKWNHNALQGRFFFYQVSHLVTLCTVKTFWCPIGHIQTKKNITFFKNSLQTTSLVTWNSGEGIFLILNLTFLRYSNVC